MKLERFFLRPYLPLKLAGVALLLLTGALGASAANSSPPALAGAGQMQFPALPGTALGRRLAALITTFNCGDPRALQALIADSFEPGGTGRASPADRAERLHRLFKITGGLAPRRVKRSNATAIPALAQVRMTGA